MSFLRNSFTGISCPTFLPYKKFTRVATTKIPPRIINTVAKLISSNAYFRLPVKSNALRRPNPRGSKFGSSNGITPPRMYRVNKRYKPSAKNPSTRPAIISAPFVALNILPSNHPKKSAIGVHISTQSINPLIPVNPQ